MGYFHRDDTPRLIIIHHALLPLVWAVKIIRMFVPGWMIDIGCVYIDNGGMNYKARYSKVGIIDLGSFVSDKGH